MKTYTLNEIKTIFKKVFDYKAKKDKEEDCSCAFRPQIYKFISFDELTKEIHYQVHDADTFAGDASPYYFDEKISLNNLLEKEKDIK